MGWGQKGIYCCRLIDKVINNTDNNNNCNNTVKETTTGTIVGREREAEGGADEEGRLEMDGWNG